MDDAAEMVVLVDASDRALGPASKLEAHRRGDLHRAFSVLVHDGTGKLLLQKREINRLTGAVEREGMTIVPLKLYFNDKGRAKVEIALARGKKLHDKRETLKKRSWERERGRLMRMKG